MLLLLHIYYICARVCRFKRMNLFIYFYVLSLCCPSNRIFYSLPFGCFDFIRNLHCFVRWKYTNEKKIRMKMKRDWDCDRLYSDNNTRFLDGFFFPGLIDTHVALNLAFISEYSNESLTVVIITLFCFLLLLLIPWFAFENQTQFNFKNEISMIFLESTYLSV